MIDIFSFFLILAIVNSILNILMSVGIGKNFSRAMLVGYYLFCISTGLAYFLHIYYPFEPNVPNVFAVIASIFGIFIAFFFLHRLNK